MRDKCQLCDGRHGGVPGNENIIEEVTLCDYCHAIILRWLSLIRRTVGAR